MTIDAADGRGLAAAPALGGNGREEELAQDTVLQRAYRAAAARGDLDVIPVWAGEALDVITSVGSVADIVAEFAAGAERALTSACNG